MLAPVALGALVALAALAAAAWLGLLLHPARPWDFRPVDDEPGEGGHEHEHEEGDGGWPAVAVLVPARDEADTLPATLPPLLEQDYPGPLSIVLVDDRSGDGTAEVARRLARASARGGRLTIVEGTPLPVGWVGKMWALEQGARAAFPPHGAELRGGPGFPPHGAELRGGPGFGPAASPAAGAVGAASYVLLTDADILHAPDSLRRLVAGSRREGLALDSRMARLRCEALWERVLIPAFVWFFNLLYPMRRVNRPDDRMAAAAGGCVLLSREAYEAIGGLASIRDEIIDDVNLARRVKARGLPIRLCLSRSAVVSHRGYDTLGGIWRMVRRTAFTELGYSWLKLWGCVAVMTAVFLVPVAALAAGLAGVLASGGADARAAALAGLGGVTLALMAVTYRPAVRFYGLSPLYALAPPLVALLYMGMTVDSAVRHALGVRSSWRGRAYRAAP